MSLITKLAGNQRTWVGRALFFGFVLYSNQAYAQLNRYWSNNFSEEASLVSGAVVGGGAGPSAVFYNPAIIAQIRDSRFTLNADVVTLETYRWENVLGDGETIKSFGPRVAPSFFCFVNQA